MARRACTREWAQLGLRRTKALWPRALAALAAVLWGTEAGEGYLRGTERPRRARDEEGGGARRDRGKARLRQLARMAMASVFRGLRHGFGGRDHGRGRDSKRRLVFPLVGAGASRTRQQGSEQQTRATAWAQHSGSGKDTSGADAQAWQHGRPGAEEQCERQEHACKGLGHHHLISYLTPVPDQLRQRLLSSQRLGMAVAEHDGPDADASPAQLLTGVEQPAAEQQLRPRLQQRRLEQRHLLPDELVDAVVRLQLLPPAQRLTVPVLHPRSPPPLESVASSARIASGARMPVAPHRGGARGLLHLLAHLRSRPAAATRIHAVEAAGPRLRAGFGWGPAASSSGVQRCFAILRCSGLPSPPDAAAQHLEAGEICRRAPQAAAPPIVARKHPHAAMVDDGVMEKGIRALQG
ncbi:unnamed protein product [Miscanthus lutarioriparius]|uniref:Uncharacterized protein n=1 Tax=Miscanthus lutarioriparius TaxID=422564 RepID=A0A811NN66_9POAL|nr:unnamed protein product [Miscanthus lutarioriparius]